MTTKSNPTAPPSPSMPSLSSPASHDQQSSEPTTPVRGRRTRSNPTGSPAWLLPEISTTTFDFFSSSPPNDDSPKSNMDAFPGERKRARKQRMGLPRVDSEIMTSSFVEEASRIPGHQIHGEESPSHSRGFSNDHLVNKSSETPIKRTNSPAKLLFRPSIDSSLCDCPKHSLSFKRRNGASIDARRTSKVASSEWESYISGSELNDSDSAEDIDDTDEQIEMATAELETATIVSFSRVRNRSEVQINDVPDADRRTSSRVELIHSDPHEHTNESTELTDEEWETTINAAIASTFCAGTDANETTHLLESSLYNADSGAEVSDIDSDTDMGVKEEDAQHDDTLQLSNVSTGSICISHTPSAQRRQSERIRLDADAPIPEHPEVEAEDSHPTIRFAENPSPTPDPGTNPPAPQQPISKIRSPSPLPSLPHPLSTPHLPTLLHSISSNRLSSPLLSNPSSPSLPLASPRNSLTPLHATALSNSLSNSLSQISNRASQLISPNFLDGYLAASIGFLAARGHEIGKMGAEERSGWWRKRMRERCVEGGWERDVVEGLEEGEVAGEYVRMRMKMGGEGRGGEERR